MTSHIMHDSCVHLQKTYCSAIYVPLFHQSLTQMIFNTVGIRHQFSQDSYGHKIHGKKVNRKKHQRSVRD